jgi:hypothetical protein
MPVLHLRAQRARAFEMAQRLSSGENKNDGGAEEKLMERVRCVLLMCAPLFKGMDIKFAGTVRLHYVDSVMRVSQMPYSLQDLTLHVGAIC